MSAPIDKTRGMKRGLEDVEDVKDRIGTRKPNKNTDALTLEYKRILKETGIRLNRQNVIPNLTRTFSNSTNSNEQPSCSTQLNPPHPMETNKNNHSENNSDDWQTAKKTVRQPKQTDKGSTPIDNSFDALNNVNDTGDSTVRTNNLKKIIMMLYVANSDISFKDLINLIKSLEAEEDTFRLRQPLDSNFITVSTRYPTTFIRIKNALKEKKIHFFSHTPRHLKPKTMVLKGISGGFEAAEIEKELMDRKDDGLTIKKVFEAKLRKVQGRQDFIVQIDNSNKIADLTKIKIIAFQTANWEPIKKQKVFQCRRCQRFGHASINCNMPYRCVKCGQSHEPNCCSITPQCPREKLKCTNCGQTGHPANYKGCPDYKKLLSQMKPVIQKKINNNTKRNIMPSRQVTNGLSYARATNSRQPSTGGLPSSSPIAPRVRSVSFECNEIQNNFNDSVNQTPHNNNYNTYGPPPWIQNLRNELINGLTNMIQDRRREMHEKIDNLVTELNITNA